MNNRSKNNPSGMFFVLAKDPRRFVAMFCIFLSLFGCNKDTDSQIVTNKEASSQIVTHKSRSCENAEDLKALEGTWSEEKFVTTLKDTRSWGEAIKSRNSGVTSIIIDSGKIFYTWGWHEFSNSDESGSSCVKKDGEKIWLAVTDSHEFDGPFVKMGAGDSEEKLYLAQFWSGCYKSEKSEIWCFSKDGISIDGKHLPANLQKDLSELSLYGTIFMVDEQIPPFLVFVPQNDGGWLVYKDDWASSDGYVPVKVGTDTPWRQLIIKN